MEGDQPRAALPALSALMVQRPRWVVAGAILFTVVVWGICLYSIGVQVGGTYPGFFCSVDRIVGGFTPRDSSGWQAGLRPGDRIVAVNGQHWREMRRLVRDAGIRGSLEYTVERDGQTFLIAVPMAEFTTDIMLRYLPAWVFFAILCLGVGIFVYVRDPGGRLNRYLLLYLLAWAGVMALVWESALSQNKWSAYLRESWMAIAAVAGWIFFWSFPADRARKEFLARWPLIPAYVVLAVAATIYYPSLLALASRLDRPGWWRLYRFSTSWASLIIFAGGSVFNMNYPLLQIVLKRKTAPLIRQQAIVLLLGIGLGLSAFIVLTWAPGLLHISPPASAQWGGVLTAIYPLSVGYAVLRYHLFDIRVVVRKGLVYSLLTATLTAVFLLLSLLIGYLFQGLTGRQSFLAAVLPALVTVALFQPARRRIQTFVDRAFFRREYQVRQTLTTFSRGLSTLRRRGEVVRLVEETVTETLGAGRVALLLLDDGRYQELGPGWAERPLIDSGLPAWLARERRALLLRSNDHSPHAEELRWLGARLAVPLLAGDSLLGILILGEKRSGELYSQVDLELLTTLAHSTTLALENARLHEERIAILREQLAQVTVAQESERQRIARELHDGLGPALASLNIRLHTVRKLLERDPKLAVQEIDELQALTQGNIQDIRRLIYHLRPAALDELGLVSALREYAMRYREEQGIELDLALPGGDERLPAPVETALFRIAQAALDNVAKHAQARRVEVTMTRDQKEVTLRVADDGQGFDPTVTRAGMHLGLWSMRERVEQVGGRFEVQSAPGKGATISVAVPLVTQR